MAENFGKFDLGTHNQLIPQMHDLYKLDIIVKVNKLFKLFIQNMYAAYSMLDVSIYSDLTKI